MVASLSSHQPIKNQSKTNEIKSLRDAHYLIGSKTLVNIDIQAPLLNVKST